MRIVTGIGVLEIVLSRSNLVALLEAIDDDRPGRERLTRTATFPEAIKREDWHPGALTDEHDLMIEVTVEPDEGHPAVPFVIPTIQDVWDMLGLDDDNVVDG